MDLDWDLSMNEVSFVIFSIYRIEMLLFGDSSIKSSESWYSYKCWTINLTVLYNGNQLLSMVEDLSKLSSPSHLT